MEFTFDDGKELCALLTRQQTLVNKKRMWVWLNFSSQRTLPLNSLLLPPSNAIRCNVLWSTKIWSPVGFQVVGVDDPQTGRQQQEGEAPQVF
jgi:hypothetical protein